MELLKESIIIWGEGKTRVPQVTAEKEEAIEDALRHFQMIS